MSKIKESNAMVDKAIVICNDAITVKRDLSDRINLANYSSMIESFKEKLQEIQETIDKFEDHIENKNYQFAIKSIENLSKQTEKMSNLLENVKRIKASVKATNNLKNSATSNDSVPPS